LRKLYKFNQRFQLEKDVIFQTLNLSMK
jgi:hypothetical protein